MKSEEIYKRAERNGVYLECTCVGISMTRWEELMKGATRADTNRINRMLVKQNLLQKDEIKLYNPYYYYKTKTHIIRVHSSIEHFYKIK